MVQAINYSALSHKKLLQEHRIEEWGPKEVEWADYCVPIYIDRN